VLYLDHHRRKAPTRYDNHYKGPRVKYKLASCCVTLTVEWQDDESQWRGLCELLGDSLQISSEDELSTKNGCIEVAEGTFDLHGLLVPRNLLEKAAAE
jgi:hypothetical protein